MILPLSAKRKRDDVPGSYSPRQLLEPFRRISGRRLVRYLIRLAVLSTCVALVVTCGRRLIWSTYNNTMSPADMQSFCNELLLHDIATDKTVDVTFQQINNPFLQRYRLRHAENRSEAKLEHQMAEHLAPDYTPDDTVIDDTVWKHLPVKGAFYMVIGNEDLQGARASIRSVEDRFNHQYGYPWILLSSQYFTPQFRKYIARLTKAPLYFGKIDLEAWHYPNWIVPERAELAMQYLAGSNVYQGGSLSFRQTARYHAGFFFHHPLMQKVEYSWRIDPGSDYHCDMSFDPFRYMKEHKKTIGFAVSLAEEPDAIKNLWPVTRHFMQQHSDQILPSSETIMPWIIDYNEQYNTCQLWPKFEIIDLSFLRSIEYHTYFSFLDKAGGFFYERWNEGAVRTLAAAMFLRRDQIQFFNQIGYTYGEISHCPISFRYSEQCSCDIDMNFDFHADSCTVSLLQYTDEDAILEMTRFAREYILGSSALKALANGMAAAENGHH